MKNIFFKITFLTVFGSFTNFINAQNSEINATKIGKSRSNIQNNKAPQDNLKQVYCNIILKCADGSCTVDYINTGSTKDNAITNSSEKRLHKPFVIIKEIDAKTAIHNDEINSQEIKRELSKENNHVQLISDVTAKITCEGGATTVTKLFPIASKYTLPINCKNGICDLELYWSWGAPHASKSKIYAGGRFELEMENGICTNMYLNTKDTYVTKY
ncbi:hypothetical protein [Flavobacterium sp. IMCC34518]|uniref:hypothetical protein n=1 Tax=Flavobacterium sp. IMCC34518 TaxID=3003623 RepID=UPI0022AC0E70|nr:hypothetical protein [Flavobacterium sp. IMCC34518]